MRPLQRQLRHFFQKNEFSRIFSLHVFVYFSTKFYHRPAKGETGVLKRIKIHYGIGFGDSLWTYVKRFKIDIYIWLVINSDRLLLLHCSQSTILFFIRSLCSLVYITVRLVQSFKVGRLFFSLLTQIDPFFFMFSHYLHSLLLATTKISTSVITRINYNKTAVGVLLH